MKSLKVLTPDPSPKERGANERVQFGKKCYNIEGNSYSKRTIVAATSTSERAGERIKGYVYTIVSRGE